jgi:hypothetical protein
MQKFVTTFPDVRTLQLSLGLSLVDGVTRTMQLLGKVLVRLSERPKVKPLYKSSEATYLFFDLPPGNYIVEVRSDDDTPYYQPVDIPIAIPRADLLWPAFPDKDLADQNKPLDDPEQPLAYRQQRATLTLQPTTAYPFSQGATLVRGTVQFNGKPLAAATVQRVEHDQTYRTEENGEFVLFFPKITVAEEQKPITLRATHALHLDIDQDVQLRRGMTVVSNFAMA